MKKCELVLSYVLLFVIGTLIVLTIGILVKPVPVEKNTTKIATVEECSSYLDKVQNYHNESITIIRENSELRKSRNKELRERLCQCLDTLEFCKSEVSIFMDIEECLRARNTEK